MEITPQLSINVSFMMTIILFVITVINFITSRKKDNKNDVKIDIEQNIKMNLKLDQICSTTNETRSDIKSINTQIKDIVEKQIRQEQEIKAIWKRIDELKEEK